MKYSPTTHKVLEHISFKINKGEKIGIVGRTGAGKSSVFFALTRLVDICEGQIEIDGVDIGDVNL